MENYFYVIVGIAISIVALLLRKEINSPQSASKGEERTVTDSFAQNSHIDTYGRAGKTASEGHAKKHYQLKPFQNRAHNESHK